MYTCACARTTACLGSGTLDLYSKYETSTIWFIKPLAINFSLRALRSAFSKAGCWLVMTDCWLVMAGCWLVMAGCWLVMAGCWLVMAGCWLVMPLVCANNISLALWSMY